MANDVNSGDDHGIYLWRDPRRNGYPIRESDIKPLITFAKNKGIKRILYDNWGTGKNQNVHSDAGQAAGEHFFDGRVGDDAIDQQHDAGRNEGAGGA